MNNRRSDTRRVTKRRFIRRHAVIGWTAVLVLGLTSRSGRADDVRIQPPSGSGLVVTNSAGNQEHLRVNEDGGVFLPGLVPNMSPTDVLCTNAATGQVGSCALQAVGPQGDAGGPGMPGPTGDAGPAGPSSPFPPLPESACPEGQFLTYNGSAYVCSAAPIGPAIIQVCQDANLTCAGTVDCPTDYTLNATCPAGYVRLNVVQCSKPFNSPNLHASVFIDPTLDNQAGCRFQGTESAFPPVRTERVWTRMLCMEDLPSPCVPQP